MKQDRLLLLVLLCCLFAVEASAQYHATRFIIDERFEDEVKLPLPAIDAIRQDKEVKYCEDQYRNFNPELLERLPVSEWFSATEIDLNDDGLPDLLVEAKRGLTRVDGTHLTHCLYPATRQWYWVLLNQGGVYRSILGSTTYQLTIDNEKSLGVRNVTTDWCTANTCYQTTYGFDGDVFKKKFERSYPN